MITKQQTIDFSGGVYDGAGDILAAEKRRNDRLREARQVNANSEALAQIQAGLDSLGSRLANNTPTAAPQPVQAAALVDRLAQENATLKLENSNLKIQLARLQVRYGIK